MSPSRSRAMGREAREADILEEIFGGGIFLRGREVEIFLGGWRREKGLSGGWRKALKARRVRGAG